MNTQFDKIHNRGQARLFRNRYLEYLTKAHPLLIWGIYIPVIIAMLYYATESIRPGPWKMIFIFTGGTIFWTFFEYMVHRFAFHFIAESEKASKFVYIIHGNHHEYPRDKERLFMPPLPSLILATSIFAVLYLTGYLLSVKGYVFVFFPGFVFGYLMYGTMHYAIHAWNPPYKWMKPLWRNHHLHHYKDEHKGFGVSTTLWDRLFGTMYDLKKEKENKEKVGELMF